MGTSLSWFIWSVILWIGTTAYMQAAVAEDTTTYVHQGKIVSKLDAFKILLISKDKVQKCTELVLTTRGTMKNKTR